MNSFLDRSDDTGRLVLRLGVAVTIFFHGYAKLFNGVGWISGMPAQLGVPGFAAYGVSVAEIVAPMLLIVGVYSRLAAATIVFDTFVAIVLALRTQILAVKEMGGGGWGIEVEALLFCGVVAIWFFGAGKYAVRTGGKWN